MQCFTVSAEIALFTAGFSGHHHTLCVARNIVALLATELYTCAVYVRMYGNCTVAKCMLGCTVNSGEVHVRMYSGFYYYKCVTFPECLIIHQTCNLSQTVQG